VDRLGHRAVVVLERRLVPVGGAAQHDRGALDGVRLEAGHQLDRQRLPQERRQLVRPSHPGLRTGEDAWLLGHVVLLSLGWLFEVRGSTEGQPGSSCAGQTTGQIRGSA
jgi:hypothetical protein